MKINNRKIYFLIFIILIGFSTLFAGCPSPVSERDVQNGDFFRRQIESKFFDEYAINFSNENTPTVTIAYQLDGMDKLASFQLDGYDPLLKIGYIVVTNEDKAEWEEELEIGSQTAPELYDAALIQDYALKYENPVIFMWMPEYQEGVDAIDVLNEALDQILEGEEIKEWAEKALYNGEGIKRSVEYFCLHPLPYYLPYTIAFSKESLPTVKIEYGEGMETVFQIDGYDPSRKIGYKFVTAEDEKNWNDRREQGDLAAPDLSKSKLIKDACLKYDFPVIFIYEPMYWKVEFIRIINDIRETLQDLEDLKGER